MRVNTTIAAAICALIFTASCRNDTPATTATQSGQPAPAATPSASDRQPDTTLAANVQSQDDAQSAELLKKWTGDLDGMIERRFIRVLTTYSKTMFFVDKNGTMVFGSR